MLVNISVFDVMQTKLNYDKYTIHNKFSNLLCFESFCAHLCEISNNSNCNDENRIVGKRNHEYIWGEKELQEGSVSKIHIRCK